MTENTTELTTGTRVYLRHGPFVSIWEVIDVTDVGARFAHVGPITFQGFEGLHHSPSGLPLTSTPDEDFIGRAHLDSLVTVPAE